MTMMLPRLRTREGTWEGFRQGELAVFRGIRYAAAPIGHLRWAPPERPPRFDGVRLATERGPACPQPAGWDRPYRAAARLAGLGAEVVALDWEPTGEDCLCLDAWTPEAQPGAGLPVLIWIHGGASAFGSGSAAMFDGARLAAEQRVVVVSINYRLGVLGFLAHSELARESREDTAGNYGFLDQVAALEWVRENAAGLGGDPDNVTVIGESAGGRAVFELLAHEPARGLFRQGIAQSPWDDSQHHRRLESDHHGTESAFALGRRLAAELGLSGPDVLAEMRRLPTHDLLTAADRIGFAASTWGPIVDGVVFPDHPLAMAARSESAAVPLLLGWNADEATIFFLGDLPFATADAHRSYIESSHPEAAAELLEIYPPSDRLGALRKSFAELYGDRTFVFPSLLAAKSLAERTPVHLYHFTHIHPPFSDAALAATQRRVGCYHASEIPLVFDTLAGGPLDEHDEPLGRLMRQYWANFARGGDPNGEGLPVWPSFRAGEERYLELGDQPVVRSHPLAKRFTALSRALYPRLGLQ